MSVNITMPAARVPLVDDRGLVTREWLVWMLGMYQRAGGYQGFDNQELYGESASQMSHDEMLQRLGAVEASRRDHAESAAIQELMSRVAQLEAANRQLVSTIQQIALGAFDQVAPPQRVEIASELDKLTVRGNALLSTMSGRTAVGTKTPAGTALFYVNGAADAETEVRVKQTRVVGQRVTGITAYTAYGGQTMGAAYSQAQAQSTDNALKAASEKLALIVAALRAHGLIGD